MQIYKPLFSLVDQYQSGIHKEKSTLLMQLEEPQAK